MNPYLAAELWREYEEEVAALREMRRHWPDLFRGDGSVFFMCPTKTPAWMYQELPPAPAPPKAKESPDA